MLVQHEGRPPTTFPAVCAYAFEYFWRPRCPSHWVSWGGLGIWRGYLLVAFLGRCSRYVQLGGASGADPSPGGVDYISTLAWECLGIPQPELEKNKKWCFLHSYEHVRSKDFCVPQWHNDRERNGLLLQSSTQMSLCYKLRRSVVLSSKSVQLSTLTWFQLYCFWLSPLFPDTTHLKCRRFENSSQMPQDTAYWKVSATFWLDQFCTNKPGLWNVWPIHWRQKMRVGQDPKLSTTWFSDQNSLIFGRSKVALFGFHFFKTAVKGTSREAVPSLWWPDVMNLGPWKSSMHLGDSATVDGAHAVH